MAHRQTNPIALERPAAIFPASRIEQISHDFRAPLNVIIGFTQLLLDESPGKINEEQRRNLNDILNSAGRLLELVNKAFTPPPSNPS
jgi:signal transduction histidine kinase